MEILPDEPDALSPVLSNTDPDDSPKEEPLLIDTDPLPPTPETDEEVPNRM